MMLMPSRTKDTQTKQSGAQASRKRAEKEPKGKRTSAKESSRFAGLFSAPARILGPRLLFIASVVLLCALGLVMVYSASSIEAFDEFHDASYFFDRQVVFLALGVVACVVLALIPYSVWGRPPVFIALWVIACLMLLLTAFGGGVEALGAERSIVIAGFNLQPSEFAKIAVILAIASLISMLKNGELSFQHAFAFIAIAALVPIFLIYRQPDLGTAIILIVGLLSLMVLSGVSWKPIAIIIGIAVAYFVVVCILQPYHIDRIVAMFDPWLDPSGDGYQSIQSFYAFGSGGLFGTGLGLSRQKYLYLPEAHTDFIFAIIGEELGLVGTLFTVGLFAVFIFSGLRICRTAPDMLGCLFAGGLTVMIGFQACVNIAQTCGVAPVTGKALPLVSYGGSSLVATLMMVGIILSVSRCSRIGIAHERRRDDLVVLDGKKGRAGQRADNTPRAGAAAEKEGKVISLFSRVRPERPTHDERGRRQERQDRYQHRASQASSRRHTSGGEQGSRRRQETGAPRGRIEYPSQSRTRDYATRSRKTRTSTTVDRAADRPNGARSGSARRRRPGSSTKPANPSGTNRRNR